MSFRVLWFPQPRKYIEGLPKAVASRILAKMDEVLIDPFRYLEHFEGPDYKLRIGDYRGLIEADFDNKILRVRVFYKRERIY